MLKKELENKLEIKTAIIAKKNKDIEILQDQKKRQLKIVGELRKLVQILLSIVEFKDKAVENNCFRGKGMGFFVKEEVDNLEVRSWCAGNSLCKSGALGGGGFNYYGHFLRVFDKIGEPDATKITPNIIIKYLNSNPIKNRKLANSLLNAANKFYQKQ